jgi:hypothetical protein
VGVCADPCGALASSSPGLRVPPALRSIGDSGMERIGRRVRILVLSYSTGERPRGERTRRVVESLRSMADVTLISGPEQRPPDRVLGKRITTRALGTVRRRLLVDTQEPWAWIQSRKLSAEYDGALLIGAPFSPPAWAARRLTSMGTPYVVDVGDPWVLTSASQAVRGVALMRARSLERHMWAHACGAVLTTRQQKERLKAAFPTMQVLIRPNGVEPSEVALEARAPARDEVLRLVQFGLVSDVREDVRPALARLAGSGHWSHVEVDQYGPDHSGWLSRPPKGTTVRVHALLPWKDAVSVSKTYDAAIVMGNRDGSQLPSKAISYLSLPIPRIALTYQVNGSALSEYVRDKQAWLTAAIDDPRLGYLVNAHTSRSWSAAAFSIPEAELWPTAADQIARFVVGRLRGLSDGSQRV